MACLAPEGRLISHTRIVLQEPECEAGRRTRIILKITCGDISPAGNGSCPERRRKELWLKLGDGG
jgi:hypothetical protein